MVSLFSGKQNLFCQAESLFLLLSACYLWGTSGLYLGSYFVLFIRAPFIHLSKSKILYHCYADDTQLYLPLKSGENGFLHLIFDSLRDINCWICKNFFNLNQVKKDIIIFTNPDLARAIANGLGPLSFYVHSHVNTLGVNTWILFMLLFPLVSIIATCCTWESVNQACHVCSSSKTQP